MKAWSWSSPYGLCHGCCITPWVQTEQVCLASCFKDNCASSTRAASRQPWKERDAHAIRAWQMFRDLHCSPLNLQMTPLTSGKESHTSQCQNQVLNQVRAQAIFSTHPHTWNYSSTLNGCFMLMDSHKCTEPVCSTLYMQTWKGFFFCLNCYSIRTW